MPASAELLVAVVGRLPRARGDVARQARALVEALRGRRSAVLADPLDGVAARRGGARRCGRSSTRSRRFRRRAEVPARVDARVPAPSAAKDALVRTTLDGMAARRDVRPGGRRLPPYSVDDRWLVPHFEKMLYDNALLAPVYLHAWVVTGEERYRHVVEETLDYTLRELRLRGRLRLVAGRRHRRRRGADPHWTADEGAPAELLEPFEHGRSIIRGELDEGTRRRLLEIREARPQPARDDKAIASWNGLQLAALAEAGRRLDRADLVEAAASSAGSCSDRCPARTGRPPEPPRRPDERPGLPRRLRGRRERPLRAARRHR